MFWDLAQDRQIGRAQTKAAKAQSAAERSVHKIKQLEDKVDGLALACQALWEILRDQSGLTDKQLEAKMEEVDLRDGQLDGKISNVTSACPKCGRKTNRRRPNCMYCGVSVGESELFDRK